MPKQLEEQMAVLALLMVTTKKEDRESYFITTFNDPTKEAARNLSGVKQRGERFLVFDKHVKPCLPEKLLATADL